DLPQVRPDDPGARVLLVPGPGADEGTPAAAGRAFRARGVAAPVRRPGRVGADHGGRPGQAVRVAAAAPRRSGQGRPGRRRGVGAGPAVTGVEAHGCRNTLSGPGKGKCSAKAYPRFCKCRQIREMRIHTVEDRSRPVRKRRPGSWRRLCKFLRRGITSASWTVEMETADSILVDATRKLLELHRDTEWAKEL